MRATGFDVEVHRLAEPIPNGGDVADAHRFVLGLLGRMLDDHHEDARRRPIKARRSILDAHLTSDGVALDSGAG